MNDSEAGCLLCGDRDQVYALFTVFGPICRCRRCGLVFAEPPTRVSGPKAYDESYYRGLVYADYLADRPAIHTNARRALTELEGMTAGRRLLDVGCATGFFLEAARARGWSVQGLEVSEYAADYARQRLGLAVDIGSIASPPRALGEFDVVTMWDVIEHLERPDQALRSIRRMLRPKGLLIISTGDYGSVLRRIRGKKWRLFADPTHRFFFDERTLRVLLAETGYNVINVRRRGKWVSLPMILQQSLLPLRSQIMRLLERSGLRLFAYVNPRDVMTLTVRRAEQTASN
jgi:SAM-dependent methyltransferase